MKMTEREVLDGFRIGVVINGAVVMMTLDQFENHIDENDGNVILAEREN